MALSKYDVIEKVANCIEIWGTQYILAFLSIVFNKKYRINNCLVFKDSTVLPTSENSEYISLNFYTHTVSQNIFSFFFKLLKIDNLNVKSSSELVFTMGKVDMAK